MGRCLNRKWMCVPFTPDVALMKKKQKRDSSFSLFTFLFPSTHFKFIKIDTLPAQPPFSSPGAALPPAIGGRSGTAQPRWRDNKCSSGSHLKIRTAATARHGACKLQTKALVSSSYCDGATMPFLTDSANIVMCTDEPRIVSSAGWGGRVGGRRLQHGNSHVKQK